MNNILIAFNTFKKSSDIYFAIIIFAIISIIIFPVPPFLLDFFIITNIVISMMVLMLSFYIPNALGLSTFPSILLVTTLFRLALNIASTKQILLHAHAGQMIDAFGKIVVGGNLVVGIVVFLIITIVQFIVIVKGSERVAEVGARFTLDAMPGKQMSIDADLRAGMISKDEAKAKRNMVSQESQLHGAMDGAMKFVKGDAIAGLIISAINLLAGMAIGNLMLGMTLSDAANRYSILSIGDGMISQIPSLLISISAGIIITRVSTSDESKNLAQDLTRELTAHPRAIGITCLLILGFFLVPGFPKLQILTVGIGLLLITYYVMKQKKQVSTKDFTPMPAFKKPGQGNMPIFINNAGTDFSIALHLKISSQFKACINPEILNAEILSMRQQITQHVGLPFPGLRVSILDQNSTSSVQFKHSNEDDPSQSEQPVEADAKLQFKLFIHDSLVADVSLEPKAHFYSPQQIVGLADKSNLDRVLTAGQYCYLYSAPESINGVEALSFEALIAYVLSFKIKQKANDLFGMQEVRNLINSAESHVPDLTAEVQRALPLQRIADVLKRLVDEGVSVRNIGRIFEALIVWGSKEKDVNMLTEYIRVEIGQTVVERYLDAQGVLQNVIFDQPTEAALKQALQQSNLGNFIALPKEKLDVLISQIDQFQKSQTTGTPVIIVSFELRRYVKKLIEPEFPNIAVLSYQEIKPDTKMNTSTALRF